MPPKAVFHDLVLGGSMRLAIAALKGFDEERQDTIRVIAKQSNAKKQMADEDVVSVFSMLGDLKDLKRLELLNSYGTKRNLLLLPAKALALALQKAKYLRDVLIVGVRISGSVSDIGYLAGVVMHHPSLKRLFVTDLNHSPGSSSLVPFLHGASMNPGLEVLSIRNSPWAGQSLHSMDHKVSGLKSLRLTGAICLQPIEWFRFIEGLQFNSSLKQVHLTGCGVSPGLGAIIAKLLVFNKELEDFVIELPTFADTLPVCQSMMMNRSLKRLEILVSRPEPGADQDFITKLFADAISKNCSLEYFFIRTPHCNLTNPCLDFYLRLNRCGKRKALEQPPKALQPNDWVDALYMNNNDVSILYYILQLNPALCRNQPRSEVGGRRCLERKRKKLRVK